MKSILIILVLLFIPATGAEVQSIKNSDSHEGHLHSSPEEYYTCSMHPSVRSDKPGSCPICSMGLIHVKRKQGVEAGITIDAQRRQTIGVRTDSVTKKPLHINIRAVGKITFNESRLTDINLKIEGWIERLFANKSGQWIKKGNPLFELYSPGLYSTQMELLSLIKQGDTTLAENARTRLQLWGLSEDQVENIIRSNKALLKTPFLSPVSGYVVEKKYCAGQPCKKRRKTIQDCRCQSALD